MKPFDLNLDDMLKRLHLANARRAWRALVARAEKEEWTYHDFLSTLVAEEVAHRQQTRIQRYSQRSRFPFLKTVDDFDFTYFGARQNGPRSARRDGPCSRSGSAHRAEPVLLVRRAGSAGSDGSRPRPPASHGSDRRCGPEFNACRRTSG
jgi:hypothetical protein